MDEARERLAAQEAAETLSRTELQLEFEKLRLERERIALERERLEMAQNRTRVQEGLQTDGAGRMAVGVSTAVLVSIICLLVGGIMGAVSSSVQMDRRSSARLQEMVDSLAAADVPVAVVSNEVEGAESALPPWLRAVSPRRAYSGVSVVVLQ